MVLIQSLNFKNLPVEGFKDTILVEIFDEYQNDIPNMKNIKKKYASMKKSNEFKSAVKKLLTERFIENVIVTNDYNSWIPKEVDITNVTISVYGEYYLEALFNSLNKKVGEANAEEDM